jgi:transcriptional regulator with XRE-family HTH domain
LDGVGENIQKTRTARGINQGELAARAGVDRAYISLVENGKQNLTMSALVKFADALSITVASIIPNDNYNR